MEKQERLKTVLGISLLYIIVTIRTKQLKFIRKSPADFCKE